MKCLSYFELSCEVSVEVYREVQELVHQSHAVRRHNSQNSKGGSWTPALVRKEGRKKDGGRAG